MWVALVAAAYLLGTFPSASIVALGVRRRHHARSARATPAPPTSPAPSAGARVSSSSSSTPSKGAVATLVGLWIGGRAGGYVLGAAAILGHIFPVTRRFRGGKGVATGAGALVVLHPVVAAVSPCCGWGCRG